MSWVELDPGKRVQIIRPLSAELQDFARIDGQTDVDRMALCASKYVVGWDGITEADLLGADQASPMPVPFDVEVWAEVVRDRRGWMLTVVEALMGVITAHEERVARDAKN